MSNVVSITAAVRAHCRSCGTAVIWATTDDQHRKLMVDANPAASGNVWLYEKDGRLFAAVVSEKRQPPSMLTPLYRSHFSTCPSDVGRYRGKPWRGAHR